MSGSRSKCSDANSLPVRPIPHCTSSAINRDAVFAAEGLESMRRNSGCGGMNPPLSLNGFHEYRRHLVGRNRVVEHRIRQQVEALHVARVGLPVDGTSITVRVVGVEDIRQQRPEAPTLYGFAGGERQGAERAPVEGAIKRDDLRPTGTRARELDRRPRPLPHLNWTGIPDCRPSSGPASRAPRKARCRRGNGNPV